MDNLTSLEYKFFISSAFDASAVNGDCRRLHVMSEKETTEKKKEMRERKTWRKFKMNYILATEQPIATSQLLAMNTKSSTAVVMVKIRKIHSKACVVSGRRLL